jgi:dATP pyrophosphohydrolase
MAGQPHYRRPESVLVVVHTDDSALLLQRITPPIFWQSVTGSLEPGEDPEAAASRELTEETGIAEGVVRSTGIVRTFEIFESARHLYAPGITRNREYLFYLRLQEACDIRLSEDEHQEFGWIPIPQAVDRVLSWTNALALRALL